MHVVCVCEHGPTTGGGGERGVFPTTTPLHNHRGGGAMKSLAHVLYIHVVIGQGGTCRMLFIFI